jgi:hypothetical protein
VYQVKREDEAAKEGFFSLVQETDGAILDPGSSKRCGEK